MPNIPEFFRVLPRERARTCFIYPHLKQSMRLQFMYNTTIACSILLSWNEVSLLLADQIVQVVVL